MSVYFRIPTQARRNTRIHPSKHHFSGIPPKEKHNQYVFEAFPAAPPPPAAPDNDDAHVTRRLYVCMSSSSTSR